MSYPFRSDLRTTTPRDKAPRQIWLGFALASQGQQIPPSYAVCTSPRVRQGILLLLALECLAYRRRDSLECLAFLCVGVCGRIADKISGFLCLGCGRYQ